MTGRSRRYSFPGRDHRTHVRFTATEYAELAAAAARVGLATTGYVGEAAVAAARGVTAAGETEPGAISRAELAQLQRDLFAARTAVNQAAAALRQAAAGPAGDEALASCVRSVEGLDALVARIHRQLRRATGPADGQQQHVGYESWLERDHMLLDHDQVVVAVTSQPFWLFWPVGEGRVRSRVPAYCARLADGSALVVDCRPVERIKPKNMATFEATGAACELVGWQYRLVGAPDAIVVANVRWLAGYRHRRHDLPAVRRPAAGDLRRAVPVDGRRRAGR